jgi:hypothetical protein
VRILDLARTLVRLSGGGRADDSIVFTGLRPGEKLHEELVAPGERATPTAVPKVRILDQESARSRGVLQRLPRWDRLLWLGETDPVVADLFRVVPERRRRVDSGSRRKTDVHANGNGAHSLPAGGLVTSENGAHASNGHSGNGYSTHGPNGISGNGVEAQPADGPEAHPIGRPGDVGGPSVRPLRRSSQTPVGPAAGDARP